MASLETRDVPVIRKLSGLAPIFVQTKLFHQPLKARIAAKRLRYLLEHEYAKRNIELRACHPRDLIDQLIDIARFTRTQPTMSRELLTAACKSYFVEM